MRSKQRLKFILNTFCGSLLVLLLHGCVAEDLSQCLTNNVALEFQYTYNEEDADLYEQQQIRAIDLYVFDENDRFEGHYSADGTDVGRSGYTFNLMLPPGNYHLVAWARGEGPAYSVSGLTPTYADTFADAMLWWDVPAPERVETPPVALYHAEVSDLTVVSKQQPVSRICYLTKDVNLIEVTAKNLPDFYEHEMTSIEISAKHGAYSFDNSIAEQAQRLTYIPSYLPDTEFRKADFRLLKLEPQMESQIIISAAHTLPDGQISRKEFYNGNLMGLLLKDPELDLLRQHTFVLEFDFSNDKEVIISINGWIIREGNQDIE